MEFKPSGTVGVPIAANEPKPYNPEGRPIFTPGGMPQVLEVIDPRRGPVNQWSISRIFEFEKCPHSVYLAKVEGIKQESGEAANRGSRIHDLAEQFVNGEIGEMPNELKKFASSFIRMREHFIEGDVELEGEWGFDLNWEPTPWVHPNTWSRHKLDLLFHESETSAIVVDYKTGKKFGNEMKHNTQGMDYAIATFMRYPKLEFIRTEFWYLDEGTTLVNTYTRAQAMVLLPSLENRAKRLTSCMDFIPKPSNVNCKWCSYRGNACEWSE